MARKITKLGHTVKGALAAHLAPRLAADAAFKPGELDALLRSVKPGPFKEQIPLISDAVAKQFKDRLAKDADISDLAELLEALGGSEEPDDDDEEGEDKFPAKAKDDDDDADMGVGTDDDDDLGAENPGVKLMKMLGGYNIPSADLETINGLVTALGKGSAKAEGQDADKKAKDTDKKAKDNDKDQNGAPMKDVPVTKPAMDAALAEHGSAVRKQIAALYDAANEVRPYIGEVNVLSFDSAENLYKLALDSHQINTKGVHPSAYRSLLPLIDAQRTIATGRPAEMAADAASLKSFEETYTHIPGRA